MAAFTLDTSGAVYDDGTRATGTWRAWGWSDLSPFEQGYVEALFASGVAIRGEGALMRVLRPGAKPVGFSDLSPEALERIRKDCGEFSRVYGEWPLPEHGKGFWIGRCARRHAPRFGPLHVFLSDEGKVCLREEG